MADQINGGNAPEPGAMLLQVSDISQADGLDPASAIQRYKLKTALHTVKAFLLPRGAR